MFGYENAKVGDRENDGVAKHFRVPRMKEIGVSYLNGYGERSDWWYHMV